MADTSSKTLVLWNWHIGSELLLRFLTKTIAFRHKTEQNTVNRNSVAKYAFSSATPEWTLLSTHK